MNRMADDALAAELAAWDAMSDAERDAAALEWLDAADADAAQYAADSAADAAHMAAYMAEAEAAQAAHIAAEDARVAGALVQVGPYTYADPTCRQCRGTGIVTDSVDYGSTTAQLESPCDCAVDYLWAVEDGDGIALEKDGRTIHAKRRGKYYEMYLTGKKRPWYREDAAEKMLASCATIAPLTAWQVVWDDMGADDAPRY